MIDNVCFFQSQLQKVQEKPPLLRLRRSRHSHLRLIKQIPSTEFVAVSVERYSIVHDHPSQPKGLGCWGFPGVGAGLQMFWIWWSLDDFRILHMTIYMQWCTSYIYSDILYMKNVDQTNIISPNICSNIRDMARCYHPLIFSSSPPVKRRIIFELRCFRDHLFV